VAEQIRTRPLHSAAVGECAGSLLLPHHLQAYTALVALTLSLDLFICAKDLLVEAMARPS
jgi:hypothetical protein